MTALYAESSAVLRWLLGAPDAPALQAALAGAPEVVSSTLTSAEVGRTLRRLVAVGAMDPDTRDRVWARYLGAAGHWILYAVGDTVLSRVAEPFPIEPLRTLDAVHLATAARHAHGVGPVRVLSVDVRVRENAVGLGLPIVPAPKT